MKSIFIACAICAVSTAAFSAEKKTFNLSPNDMFAMSRGLSMLDGYHRIVKDARGQDVDAIVPYDMAATGIRITIAHDITALALALRDYQNAAKGLPADQANELATKEQPIDLLTISINELRVEQNPYPASALSMIHVLTDEPGK